MSKTELINEQLTAARLNVQRADDALGQSRVFVTFFFLISVMGDVITIFAPPFSWCGILVSGVAICMMRHADQLGRKFHADWMKCRQDRLELADELRKEP